MNIYEAATRAEKEQIYGITRQSWKSAIIMLESVYGDERFPDRLRVLADGREWHPWPEDILATDWIAIDLMGRTEPQEKLQISHPKRDWRSSVPAVLTALLSLGISIAALLLR